MYVAMRQMLVDQPGKGVVQLAPGDEVVGFEDWPLSHRHVHLSQEIVVKSDGPVDPAKLLPARKEAEQRDHVIRRQQQSTQEAIAERLTEALVPEEAAPVADQEPASPLQRKIDVADGMAQAHTGVITCKHCPDKRFANEHGLLIHTRRKHK